MTPRGRLLEDAPRLLVERGFAPVAAFCIFLMAALTFAEVVWRYFLNTPISGVEDVKSFLLGFSIFTALPLVTWRQRHIAVRSLAHLLRGRALRVQRVLVLAGTLAGLAFISVLLFGQARSLAEDGTLSNYLDMKLAPAVYALAALAGIAALLALMQFLRLLAGGEAEFDAPAAGPE